jgi:hypothetical protein
MKKSLITSAFLGLALLGTDSAQAYQARWIGSFDTFVMDRYFSIADIMIKEGYFPLTEVGIGQATAFARNGYVQSDDFTFSAGSRIDFEILWEAAGFDLQNEVGWYSTSNPAQKSVLFTGPEGTNDYSKQPTTVTIKTRDVDQDFGIYMKPPGTNWYPSKTWYTDRELNDPNQIGWTVRNADGLGDPQGLIYEMVPGQEYIVAFDDQDTTWFQLAGNIFNTDNDYNDLVLKITYDGVQPLFAASLAEGLSAAPVPVPAAAYLFGSALVVLARYRRRES